MKSWWTLFKGEVIRLFKYKIMWFGIALSIIWVIVLALSAEADAKALMPFLLIIDTGMMSILLLASSFYFEKQEGTIKTMFVAPVSLTQILSAKVVATLLSGVISMVLVGLAMFIIHGVVINYALAILFVMLSTLAHVSIGYIIVLYSIDFMSFMMKYMGVAIALMIPVLLVVIDVIPASSEALAFISPSYAAQYLIDSLFVAKDGWLIALGVGVLIVIPSLLLPLVVYPRFKQFAIRG
jgi:ABC-type transport system involved in multi-copper enzyme maturation permease subunit